jgi:hypothetical protein
MLLENNGDYKMVLSDSPFDGFYIETILAFQKGFMIGGDNGAIYIYEKGEDPKNPYTKSPKLPHSEKPEKKEYPELYNSVMTSRIKSMSLNSTDDCIVFTTENNQIMKVNVNIERP